MKAEAGSLAETAAPRHAGEASRRSPLHVAFASRAFAASQATRSEEPLTLSLPSPSPSTPTPAIPSLSIPTAARIACGFSSSRLSMPSH